MTVEALEIQDAVVSYGNAEPVLKGVSLSVNSGEFIALLGASITALILLIPSAGFMLFIERFLKADVLSKVGA